MHKTCYGGSKKIRLMGSSSPLSHLFVNTLHHFATAVPLAKLPVVLHTL